MLKLAILLYYLRQKMKFIYLLVSIFLLIGCNSKSLSKLSMKDDDILYRENLSQTQKALFYHNDEIKATFIVTYLKSKSMEDSLSEKFIISIYDDSQNSISRYKIELNGKRSISMKRLEQDSKILKNIPFKVDWKEYYLLEFPSIKDENRLFLSIDDMGSSKEKLYFAKIAKYNLD